MPTASPMRPPERRANSGHGEAHPGPVDEAAQEIPAEEIGPEKVLRAAALLPRGRPELVGQRLLRRRVRRDDGGEDGDHDEDGDDDERGPRQPSEIARRRLLGRLGGGGSGVDRHVLLQPRHQEYRTRGSR